MAGASYGEGSSREHAAICQVFLGVKVVLAKSFQRIHTDNLVNFGILPLAFRAEQDYDRVEQGDELASRRARASRSASGKSSWPAASWRWGSRRPARRGEEGDHGGNCPAGETRGGSAAKVHRGTAGRESAGKIIGSIEADVQRQKQVGTQAACALGSSSPRRVTPGSRRGSS